MASQFNEELKETYLITVARIKRHNLRSPQSQRKEIPTFDEFRDNYAGALSGYIVAMLGAKESPARQYAAGRLN